MNRGLLGFPKGRAMQAGCIGFPPSRSLKADATRPPVEDFAAWYDASDVGSFAVSGGFVDVWQDKSEANFHLTAASAGVRPAYGLRRINGVIVPDFDGVDDYLQSSVSRSNLNSSSFIVARTDAASSYGLLGAVSGGALVWYLNSFQHRAEEAGVAIIFTQTNTIINTGIPFAAAMVLTDTTARLNLDGVSQSGSHAQVMDPGETLRVGIRVTDLYLNGQIAEIIVYDFTMSVEQENLVMAYLKAKWGTP